MLFCVCEREAIIPKKPVLFSNPSNSFPNWFLVSVPPRLCITFSTFLETQKPVKCCWVSKTVSNETLNLV